MTRRWNALRKDRSDDGASAVEYLLLVALVAVVCIVSLTYFGQQVNDSVSTVGSTVGDVRVGP